MACCLYFFQGSKTWLALLVPIFAVFASGHEAFLISISLSALLSTIFLLFTFSKKKPIMVDNPLLIKEAHPTTAENEHQTAEVLENTTLVSSADCSCDDFEAVASVRSVKKAAMENNGQGHLIPSQQDLYSESESMDQCSTTTSSEDHSSDIEWPYNMGQRLDSSDGSISDEESLIEIAIPSGQFVSPEKAPRLKNNLKHCKLCEDFYHQESMSLHKDFCADIFSEEDNLIEIDIYMGSIKI